MSTLSITLPSNTFVTNGKHVTFKAPCNSKGVTRILIGNDKQAYELRDSRQRVLPEDVIVFEKDVMVSVILDTENHFAYLQSGGGAAESEEGVTCVVDFNGRQGSVEPMTGDYTAEMVGASPAIHANQHAINGADPITPESIGAATVDHNHEGLYASVTHTHSNYALSGHTHDDSYSLKGHDHEGVYAPYNHSHGADGSIGFSQEDADKLYSAISHTHSFDELTNLPETYKPEEHVHSFNELNDIPNEFTPTMHASAHAKDGGDPITPASIGALDETEANKLYIKKDSDITLEGEYHIYDTASVRLATLDADNFSSSVLSLEPILDVENNSTYLYLRDEYNGVQTVGIQNVAHPIQTTDAATKGYVDNKILYGTSAPTEDDGEDGSIWIVYS